jgi:hypothetical protein
LGPEKRDYYSLVRFYRDNSAKLSSEERWELIKEIDSLERPISFSEYRLGPIHAFIYRFLDKQGDILYIGQSVKPLWCRMRTHTHLHKECYNSTVRIEFTSFNDQSVLDVMEAYLISKWKPKYNKMGNRSDKKPYFVLPEPVWFPYEIAGEKDLDCDGEHMLFVISNIASMWNEFNYLMSQNPSFKDFAELDYGDNLKKLYDSIVDLDYYPNLIAGCEEFGDLYEEDREGAISDLNKTLLYLLETVNCFIEED